MSGDPAAMSHCPGPETLGAFVEGKLSRAEIAEVVAHLDRCAACRAAVVELNALLPRAKTRTWPWLAAAAALLAALLVVPFVRGRSATERLAALVPSDARPVEVRLSSDAFLYAPYRGPVRQSGTGPNPDRLKLQGLAGEIVETANRTAKPEAQHDAGVALLLIDEPADAVRRLEAATEKTPNDAAAWNDLAAARYVAALHGQASLYPRALAAADHALRLHPELPAALFNRALILERLGLTKEAREAWERYLRADPSSPWAEEARQRLAKLPQTTATERFRRDRPRLESAAAAGDVATVAALVDTYRQQSRTFAEAEFLGKWGEAVQAGDASEAARLLTIARTIGDTLARTTGESLLQDAVQTIDRGDAKALAAAHVLYRKARMTYGRGEPSAAEPDLREAAKRFAAMGSPMALVARYYAANTRFDRNDIAGARNELEQLLREADALPRFAALSALVRWQLALCFQTDDAWGDTLPLLDEAARTFRRLGERNNLGFVQTLHADALLCVGRPDDAWRVRGESFALLSGEGFADRLASSVNGAARMELRAGRRDAARALLGIEIAAARSSGNDNLLVNALVREAVLKSEAGEDAAPVVREAAAAAARIPDAAIRARTETDVHFAAGAVALRHDPRRARELLGRAISEYRQYEAPMFLPDCHLLRAAANRKLGDSAAAAADLEAGIVAVERHGGPFGGVAARSGLFDTTALFQDAVRLALDRGVPERAFLYAERSRVQLGSPAADVTTLRARLAGSGVAVVELVALAEETVVFCLTEEGLVTKRVGKAVAGETELYDLVIRPVGDILDRAQALVVVADPAFAGVSFAALYDPITKRHLVQRMPVSLAASASSLQPAAGAAVPASLAAMALPAGEGRTAPLPAAIEEIAEVRQLYRSSTAIANDATYASFRDLAARAEVLHVAGHTEREPGLGEAALVFAEERASWRTVAAMRMPHAPVVVLAACETLRTPPAAQAFALSLGGGFLAAGAGDVIGTLTTIPDNDARELFRAIHRHLAAGLTAAEAVRAAQVASLASASAGSAWRSVAVLTRRIPAPRQRKESTAWVPSSSGSMESASISEARRFTASCCRTSIGTGSSMVISSRRIERG